MNTHPATVEPVLRTRRVADFAARISLRDISAKYRGGVLHQCSGVLLSVVAWVLLMLGLAQFFLAAVQQQAEQLGASLDLTAQGQSYCLAGLLLLAVSVPQWFWGKRRVMACLETDGQTANSVSAYGRGRLHVPGVA